MADIWPSLITTSLNRVLMEIFMVSGILFESLYHLVLCTDVIALL